jgi:cell division protein FtsQ
LAAKKRRRRHRRSLPLYVFFSGILIVVVAVLGISVFFRVNTVTVEGSSYYTQEQILETAGIETGKIIFMTSTSAAQDRLYSQMPYIYSVEIERRIPDTIVIKVNESEAVAYITADGKSWLIDEHCKILSEMDGANRGNYIRVTGITPVEPEIGSVIQVEQEQQTMLDSLINILKAISNADIVSKVSNLDVSNISSATFKYDSRFDVDFGSGVNADYKISKLIDVTNQLGEDKKGKIDLSRDGETRFIPE